MTRVCASLMNKKPIISTATLELRRRAEGRLGAWKGGPRPKAGAHPQRLVHELQVHQLELEMQNAELQESRDRMDVLLEKYTDLFDFAPVGYFSLDEQGRILETNLAGAALLGRERSRLINGRLSRFVAPETQPLFQAFLQRVFAGTGKQVCEVTLLKEGAAPFWASFQGVSAISAGHPRKWCRVAVLDITALKHAEEVLRRNEVLFSILIEQAPVGVYVVDDQLRLQQINPKARPVFNKVNPLDGRDLSEALHILWPPRTAEEIVRRFRHTLRTGRSYHALDFSERRHDLGTTECYEWQLQRITLPAGHHGVVCFFNDVTERKKAEAAQHRLEVLAASNQKLELEIVRRQAAAKALRQSEQNSLRLLAQSQHMQESLRLLSRQVLSAQEEERKKISRELHDVIAQTLAGINVQLAALKKAAILDADGLDQNISRTQALVQHSVDIVHRFARELRPTVLDDLGLIPALHTFMKSFRQETGIRVSLSAFAAVEQVSGNKRTVLYRVAQEALTNVARHAEATEAEVQIQKLDGTLCMRIKDNGRGFPDDRVLRAKKNKRLGLLGMRERLEMVGGSFLATSAPGQGTTIEVKIPLGEPPNAGGGGQ
jgi:PAS domain S-box-containing protein